jgi:hypothetical protein
VDDFSIVRLVGTVGIEPATSAQRAFWRDSRNIPHALSTSRFWVYLCQRVRKGYPTKQQVAAILTTQNLFHDLHLAVSVRKMKFL